MNRNSKCKNRNSLTKMILKPGIQITAQKILESKKMSDSIKKFKVKFRICILDLAPFISN